jgi:hypothetical protein
MAFLCSGVNFAALIFPPFDPPNFPSATAAGFLVFTGTGNSTKFFLAGFGSLATTAMLRRLGTRPLCGLLGEIVN